MSARVLNLLTLALIASLFSGCAFEAMAVEVTGGFLPGLVDGFLILFKFLGGQLEDPQYFDRLQEGTAYCLGYLAGAMAFLAVGALASLP
jgi:hypothetical protein